MYRKKGFGFIPKRFFILYILFIPVKYKVIDAFTKVMLHSDPRRAEDPG